MHFILLFPCIHTGHLLRKVFTAEPKPLSKIQKKKANLSKKPPLQFP